METASSPRIDALEVARSRMRVAGRLALASLRRLAASLASTEGELAYAIEGFIDPRGRPGATLSLRADLQLICQRCGERMVFALDRSARFLFVANEAELDIVPVDDDSLDAVIGSRSMDIRDWIEDEAILSLPLVPRHEDCGAGLPADGAATSDRQHPFAGLAALKRPAS